MRHARPFLAWVNSLYHVFVEKNRTPMPSCEEGTGVTALLRLRRLLRHLLHELLEVRRGFGVEGDEVRVGGTTLMSIRREKGRQLRMPRMP
jgi:hypothetical protein